VIQNDIKIEKLLILRTVGIFQIFFLINPVFYAVMW